MGDITKFYSFKYDNTTSLAADGWIWSSNITPSIGVGEGPTGENSINLATTSGASYFSIPVAGYGEYLSMGFWFKTNILPPAATYFLYVYGNTGTAFRLQIVGVSQIRMDWSTSSVVSGFSTTQFKANEWNYLELDLRIKDTTLSRGQVKINGVLELDTGLFNIPTSQGTYWTSIQFNSNMQSITLKLANLWLAKGGFKGPLIARAVKPTAEGWTIGLTPSTGTDNSALVDEDVLDQNDYVGADASALAPPGLTDTYVTGDMAETPLKLHAFGIKTIQKKVGASTVVLRGVTRYPSGSSGADDLNATIATLGTSAIGSQFVWNDHPDNITGALTGMTGGDAETMFNDCEFGVNLATS